MSDPTEPPAGNNEATSVVAFKKPANSARPEGQPKRDRSKNRERSPAPQPSGFPSTYGQGLDSNWGLTIGQHLACKIIARDRQGYTVVVEGGMPGFLKSTQR